MKTHRTSRPLNRLHAIRLGGGIVIALLLSILLAQVVKGDESPDLPPQTASFPDVQTFNQNVAVGDAADQADQRSLDDARNGSLGPAQPKDGSFELSNIEVHTDPPVPTGIIANPVPLSGWSALYHITNGWQDTVNAQRISATTGSKADNPGAGVWNAPEQGVLIVLAYDPSLNGEYLTPTRTGPVHVESYTDTCLDLLSTGNQHYYFELSTRSWQGTACGYIGPPQGAPQPITNP